MSELQRDGAIWIVPVFKQSGDPKMHELTARLGDLGVRDLVNQRMMERVHARCCSRAFQKRMTLELCKRAHERIQI